MAMASFYKVNKNQLDSLAKKEGQVIFVPDAPALYIDTSNSSRIKVGDGEKITYSLSQDATDGHKITLTPSAGAAMTITIPDNDTTYSAGAGIGLDGTSFYNKGVRNLTTGENNGTIKVNINGTESSVSIKGLASAAYTESSAYATAAQGALADSAVQVIQTGDNNGTIKVDGTNISVKGLAALAYKASITTGDITSGTLGVNRGGTGVSSITAGQVLIGNGTNAITSRAIDTIEGGTKDSTSLITSGAVKAAIDKKLDASLKGVANGIATLDAEGKVPESQLPSYVDDVLEYAKLESFPTKGEAGKIYVALDTNKTYRWSGSAYVVISDTLALGETSSTAYRGDRGATAYTHATDANRLTTAKDSGLYKIATTAHGHIKSVTAVTKADIVALGMPDTSINTTYSLTQDSTDGHKITLTPSSGTAQTITIPDNNTTYTFATGDNNGTIKITPAGGNAQNVAVKGLAALAYKSSLSKSDVGLGNVDNTSDANKPISTATQTALNNKVSKDGDTMTGGLILSGTTESSFNDKGLMIGASHISMSHGGNLGIYAKGSIFIRPLSEDTYNQNQGITIEDGVVFPAGDNNLTLGKSGNRWKTVYATTFDGIATKATNDSDGNKISTTYVKKAGDTITGDIISKTENVGFVAQGGDGRSTRLTQSGLKITAGSGTWANSIGFYDSTGENRFLAIGAFGESASTMKYMYIGPSYNTPILKMNHVNGNTEIIGSFYAGTSITAGTYTSAGTYLKTGSGEVNFKDKAYVKYNATNECLEFSFV